MQIAFSMMFQLFSLVLLFQAASLSAEDAHERVIRELFVALDMPRVYSERVERLVKQQARKVEQFSYFEDVVRQWALETIGWKSLQPRLIEIYRRNLSQADLREILTFYQSPAGQRLQKVQPVISEEAHVLAVAAAKENASKLQEMLRQRVRELEKQGIMTKKPVAK